MNQPNRKHDLNKLRAEWKPLSDKYALVLGEFPPTERFIYCLDHIECGKYGHQSLLKPVNRLAGIKIKEYNLNEIRKNFWVLDIIDDKSEFVSLKAIKRKEGANVLQMKLRSRIDEIKRFITENAIGGSMPMATIPAFTTKFLPRKSTKRILVQTATVSELKDILGQSNALWALLYRELLGDKDLNVAPIFYSPWDENEFGKWVEESTLVLKRCGLIS